MVWFNRLVHSPINTLPRAGLGKEIFMSKQIRLLIILVIGVALMGYPYFVSDGWLVFAIGAVLCYLLYLFRE